jgi:hypothetical protein
MFIYPIYYHNWKNISTIYIYKKTGSDEIFSPSNKIHREVGRAKDLSAPRYFGDSPNFTKVPSDGTYRHVSLILHHMASAVGPMKLIHSVLNKCHFSH